MTRTNNSPRLIVLRFIVLRFIVLLCAAAASASPTLALGDDFIAAANALPFGNPSVTILVDGPNGGTIDWTNAGVDDPWPDGACGFRIDGTNMPGSDWDPDDDTGWAWYGGYTDVQGDPLPIENNGIDIPDEPGSYLEFTGPYGDDCDGYVFHTPATPTSLPPASAIGLVIQFYDWDDIEFLDAGFTPFSVPDNPWGPDPDPDPPFDPCDEAPWMCHNGPGDFQSCKWTEDFNGTWHNNCPDGGGESGSIADLALLSSWAVADIGRQVRTTASAKFALPPLQVARDRVEEARDLQVALSKKARNRTRSTKTEQIQLGRIAVSLSAAERQLELCIRRVGALEKNRGREGKATAAAASVCTQAAASLADAHDAARVYRFILAETAKR